MLQVQNKTPFAATICVFNNADGVESAFGVVKATFQLRGGQLVPAEQQLPLIPVDVPLGDPLQTSLANAGELTLCKPATDVILVGHAHTGNGPQKSMSVSLKIDATEKQIQVFGDRVWKEGVLGCKPSDPEPFETMPLIFERAFGGTDPQPKDEQNIDYEPRNPIGRGLVPNNSHAKPDGSPLPNLESPQQLIRGPGDRPTPVCFAPVAPHWQPRRSRSGTYDDAWQAARAPYLPEDFDPKFLNTASDDQMVEPFFSGGETIEARGVTPSGLLAFEIPTCEMEHEYNLSGQLHQRTANLDTVIIDSDKNQIALIWRSEFPVDKDLLNLKTFTAHCRQFPQRRAAS